MTYKIPYIPKKSLTILAVGDSLEAVSLRSMLESLNYRVTVHWVGSRAELLEILKGTILTDGTIILSCHGVEAGIHLPDEPPLGPEEIGNNACLPNKVVVSLGCKTGSKQFADAFSKSGVSAYVAPTDYPEGRAALIFTSNLFFLLAAGHTLHDAVQRASAFDDEMGQFQLAFQG